MTILPILRNICPLLMIMLVLTSCNQHETPPLTDGYIEGDYRYFNSPESGWITSFNYKNGDQVSKGMLVVQLDDQTQSLALQQAKSALKEASAHWQDLLSGAREEELLVLKRQKEEINARYRLALITQSRYEHLLASKAISELEVYEARANVYALTAQIASIDADIDAKALPARTANIEAAQASVESAQIAIEEANNMLSKRHIYSEMEGMITELYHYQGEYVTQGTPIFQLLPQNARKVIFYINEKELPTIKIGQRITVHHQNRQAEASISYISPYAEYTPPILYTNKSAEVLLFRLEAILHAEFPIGLPITIERSN